MRSTSTRRGGSPPGPPGEGVGSIFTSTDLVFGRLPPLEPRGRPSRAGPRLRPDQARGRAGGPGGRPRACRRAPPPALRPLAMRPALLLHPKAVEALASRPIPRPSSRTSTGPPSTSQPPPDALVRLAESELRRDDPRRRSRACQPVRPDAAVGDRPRPRPRPRARRTAGPNVPMPEPRPADVSLDTVRFWRRSSPDLRRPTIEEALIILSR